MGRLYPDPLVRLVYAASIEDVLSVRVQHLTLTGRLLIDHRWLLHQGWRAVDRIRIGVGVVGVWVVEGRAVEAEDAETVEAAEPAAVELGAAEPTVEAAATVKPAAMKPATAAGKSLGRGQSQDCQHQHQLADHGAPPRCHFHLHLYQRSNLGWRVGGRNFSSESHRSLTIEPRLGARLQDVPANLDEFMLSSPLTPRVKPTTGAPPDATPHFLVASSTERIPPPGVGGGEEKRGGEAETRQPEARMVLARGDAMSHTSRAVHPSRARPDTMIAVTFR